MASCQTRVCARLQNPAARASKDVWFPPVLSMIISAAVFAGFRPMSVSQIFCAYAVCAVRGLGMHLAHGGLDRFLHSAKPGTAIAVLGKDSHDQL